MHKNDHAPSAWTDKETRGQESRSRSCRPLVRARKHDHAPSAWTDKAIDIQGPKIGTWKDAERSKGLDYDEQQDNVFSYLIDK